MTKLEEYKLLRETDADDAADALLRELHESDSQAYLDCVVWDVGRVEFPGAAHPPLPEVNA